MPKFFVNSNQINNNEITIKGTDVNHIVNVLRLKSNDQIEICDKDKGNNYLTTIKEIEKETVICKIVKNIEGRGRS